MARIVLTSQVRRYFGGDAEVTVEARNVMQLFKKLGELYPGVTEDMLAQGFAVAIDGEVYEDALFQQIGPDSEVVLIPKMEGGAE